MDDHIQLPKKEKWKQTHFLPLLTLILFLDFGLVSCKKWADDAIVTQSDYQALKAIKHELVDLRGVLNTWNENGPGPCSYWAGIKCVKGHVISIQLPWKGLGGRLSEKIGQLQSLRRLSLHDNVLVGPVPTSLGSLQNLRGVYLFNNRLSGTIPPSVGNCLNLQTLDLSNNQLIGIIPLSLAKLNRVYRLNLSHNLIVGNIPDEWGNLSKLAFLDLSNNAFYGKFPEMFSNLSVLNLSNNKFRGQIPETIGNITSLTSLDLSGNNLTGEIPVSIVNLQNLSFFDVSYNNLSGPVPSVLAEKFDSSSFLGNVHLCGYSNSTPCPSRNLPSPSQETLDKNRNHRKLSTKDVIIISAGALLGVLLILCCVLLCCLIRRKKSVSKAKKGKSGNSKAVPPVVGPEDESGGEMGGKLVHFDGPFVFTADDLLCATAEIMGKGTYGTAYKATLEDNNNNNDYDNNNNNNNQVAVKRLREKITKGRKEFEIEIAQLGKIRHPNILPLRAYYVGPKGEKLLVYDYMPNGSLASFLHARGPETIIPWSTRLSIAIGMTRGLCYLHDVENIVHGNLTSSNILLDEQTNPKIADVGLPRLMTGVANTDAVATAGTTGYRAPELTKMKNASAKSDVFSLGVIILELLTGKSPSEATDGLDLPQWVASIVKEEWTNEVFDVELMRDVSDIGDDLLNALKLALHCVDPSPGARPEARQVLEKLEEIKPGPTDVLMAPASVEVPVKSE
ncbi:probable leucine-rich repeat receptor-like protein kinase imk3 [Phtheirospermum japonicum]|uniref:Probable leucine-rich repeat receptor-like protein kinase imk3 n=1 Tax=Phtheirospermum japonicum TaxID=374723 RepID=A0A830C3Q7_9LAMI|nr:probable leucine-rich repeat receptor-like protein kinase imk3 [Phtheirospermum japonicum]